MPTRLAAILATTVMALASGALAQEGQWGLCPPPPISPPTPTPDAAPGVTYVHAGRLSAESEGVTLFTGGVEVQRDDRLLIGERMRYDQPRDLLTISGDVTYRTEEMLLYGESADVKLEQDSGRVRNARFFIAPAHGYGDASLVDIITPEFTSMERVSYSTCPPEKTGWQLQARRLDLDEGSNTGEAYGVTVEFLGVPFLYSPYLNFPLHGRKSGLLTPSVGTSETNGTELSVPFYWNIAPNRDATFTPRYIENRGAMLNSEYRYLFGQSAGQVGYDYLPDDRLFDNETRSFLNLDHTQQLTPNLRTYALFSEVSDDLFFEDLSTSQSLTSQTHLERRFDLEYRGENWSALTRLQSFQALTDDEAYQRLPQIRLDAGWPSGPNAVEYDLESELVRFAHADDERTTGVRFDAMPSASLPLEGDAWFVTPTLGLQYTRYDLDQGEEDLSRTLPVTSIDSGLFFERELDLGGTALVQTLEPRLYYLYVPFEQQDDFPNFDTSEYDFNFDSLFRPNRFTGPDRVGDANQLTTAITTRFLNAFTGAELASASLGQIQYFSNRKVTLDADDPDETASKSDLVGALEVRPGTGLTLSAEARWDLDEQDTGLFTGELLYRPQPGKALFFDYRERDETLRQTDVAFFWPLQRHWNVLGRWNYDLEQEQDLDTLFGLEYQDCCWAFRAVKRATLKPSTQELEHSVLLTLELKGLGSIGRHLEQELEGGILEHD